MGFPLLISVRQYLGGQGLLLDRCCIEYPLRLAPCFVKTYFNTVYYQRVHPDSYCPTSVEVSYGNVCY